MLLSLPITVHIAIWIWVLLQVVLVVVAVRVYRSRRTRPLRLLMWACVAYVFSSLGWYVFYAMRSALRYPMLSLRHPEVLTWQSYSDRAFQIIFMLLMLCSLRLFLQENRSNATRKA